MDLSKALDTVKSETLQLIWIVLCSYHHQIGVLRDGARDSRTFDILSNVQQWCALGPRLFGVALELAMSEWRVANPQVGLNLRDDMFRLLDLCVLQMTYKFLPIRRKLS